MCPEERLWYTAPSGKHPANVKKEVPSQRTHQSGTATEDRQWNHQSPTRCQLQNSGLYQEILYTYKIKHSILANICLILTKHCIKWLVLRRLSKIMISSLEATINKLTYRHNINVIIKISPPPKKKIVGNFLLIIMYHQEQLLKKPLSPSPLHDSCPWRTLS